jgi:hypothetical protein
MKKLMTLALGLAFVTGTVAVSFAAGDSATTKKVKKTKKKGSDTTGHATVSR